MALQFTAAYMRLQSLEERWALTPPFHPYPREGGYFLLRSQHLAAVLPVRKRDALHCPDFPQMAKAISDRLPCYLIILLNLIRFVFSIVHNESRTIPQTLNFCKFSLDLRALDRFCRVTIDFIIEPVLINFTHILKE